MFAEQIERNTENWKIFLKIGTDGKDYDFSEMIVKEEEEIKIEYRDDDVSNTSDALDTQISIQDQAPEDIVSRVTSKKRKIDYSERRPLFVTNSTDYERTCKLCDGRPTFSSMTRFHRHQREHHPGEKTCICDICGSRFNNKNRLIVHMDDRHGNSGKTHQCQFCAKLFYSDREVKGHEQLHWNARSYICKLCGKGFNQKTTLNVHLKSKAHNTNYKAKYKKKPYTQKFNSKKVFRCMQCVPSLAFMTTEERILHKDVCHRKFECDICKNSFMAQESLDRHRLLHSDKPRPYVCTVRSFHVINVQMLSDILSSQVCQATFNQSSHLSSHFKRKHTDEKTIHCPYCDKSFFESCERNAHVRLVHKKQDRVKCSECGSDFATEKYLRKHIQQKHAKEPTPYDCKICGKRNVNGVKLDQHRLKYHKFVE